MTTPLFAALLATVLLVGAQAERSSAAVVPLYPNLHTLAPRELKLDRADITPDLTGVFHNVLRFTNTTYNSGEGPLIVNAQIDPTTNSGPSTQRVMNSDGTFTDIALNNNVYWHQAHHHYHFDNWGKYELWTKSAYDAWIASGRTTGAPSYTGVKTTSCITDEEFVASAPGTPYPGPYGISGCDVNSQNQIHMGLSVGWGDTYDWYRQDQWIDLNQNTLSSGQYVLRSVADPLNIVYESTSKTDTTREGGADNEATTTFSVASGALVDSNPPTGTGTINHVDATTPNASVSVDVLARDDVSGVNQFRLSNDGVHFMTFNYTSSGSFSTAVAWNLTDAATGGSSANGIHTIYAQTHDNSGKWGPVFTDTIDLQASGPPPPPPSTYAELIANDGPMGYWRLNELSGTNAADSAGSNPGIYTGGPTLGAPSLLTNDGGKAATFSGSNQSVAIASSASLALASTVSLEAWVKPSSLPAAGTFASVLTKLESYSLQFNGPDMEFTIMQAGARSRLLAPAGAIVAGSKYHVVGTYDGTTQRLYINGSQVASAPLNGAITTNTNQLNIASWDGASEFLAGTVDEAAVYAAVLSPTQIANHYSTGNTGTVPPTQSQLAVSRSGTGSGTVTSAPAGINCGATCAASFNNGSSIALTAAPASGSVFTGWSGGGCSGTAGCTLTLNTNTTVSASFDPAPSTLTVTRSGAGNGNVASAPAGINCGVTCAASFAPGTSITLTAAPASGSVFSGWSGGGCSGTSTCTVVLNAHTTVTATFGLAPARLTIRHAGTGTGRVTSTPAGIACGGTCASSFAHGTSVTLTAAPASGWVFSGWSGGGCSGTGTCTLTLNTDTIVTATFNPPPSAYFQAVKADGPVGYWRLDERYGTTAADSARTDTGTYHGTVTHWVAGLLPADVDRATAFSGSNQFVGIPSTTALSRSTTVSVEAWIKPVSIPATGVYASVLTKPESYSLQLAGPKMEFTIMQAGTRHRLRAATTIVAGSVYHVVGTYNGATQRLYINGTQVASVALTGAISTNTNPLNIASWNGSSEFFGGTVDEAAVYAVVLSAAKIANHYAKGTTVTTAVSSAVSAPAAITLAGSSPVATGVDDTLGRIYVTRNRGEGQQASNGVTVIDAVTHAVVAEITTGRWGPSSLAVDPVRHLVYVTAATWGSTDDHSVVVVIDGRTNRIVRRMPVGPGPKSIAVNAKTNRVYVTDQDGMDAGQGLAVIDGATGRNIAVIPMGRYARFYENPLGLAVDSRSNTVYATNPLEGTLYIVDGATNTLKRSLALGDEPTAVAVDTATGRAFVTHAGRGSTKVSVIDGHAGAVVKSIRVAGSPRGIAIDPQGGTAYVTTAGHGTAAIDTATEQVTDLLDCGPGAYGVTVSTTGTVIVADRTDEILCVLPRRARPPIA